MIKIGWLSRLSNLQPSTAMIQRTASSMGVAALLVMATAAAAQNPTATDLLPAPGTHMSVPDGYSLH